jgi:Family of unknown function (DUF1028)
MRPNHAYGLSTYSIVGADPEAGECGVAVQSKFLAVGAFVPWARRGIGYPDQRYRRGGLWQSRVGGFRFPSAQLCTQ